ncbi:MAG: tyrosine-type recombinase/integrase [Actinomycetota bacterium]
MASGHVDYRDGPRGRSWFYTIPAPTGLDGKRRQEQRRGFRTKGAAQAAMRKRLAEIESGAYGATNKQSVEEFAALWLARIKHDVAARSHATYERTFRLHLLPRLGRKRLDRLTALDIESAYVAALDDGVSPDLVRFNHGVLKAALRRAVDWDLLSRNPAEKVRPPRRPREIEAEDRRVRALTDAEAKRLLAEVSGPAWLASVIALGTGLRRGEVLGLRWKDLDFAGGLLSVRQTVEPMVGKGTGLVIGPPKTASSARTFQAPGDLLQILREHRGRQSARRLITPDWQDYDLVLCRDNGEPFPPNRVSDWHRSARVKADLPGTRFHDLRHTFATNQLRSGVDVTAVSKQLGHSSVSITLNVYSHVLPDMQERAAIIAAENLRRLLNG